MNTLKSILTAIFFLGGIVFAQEEAVSSWSVNLVLILPLVIRYLLPVHIQDFPLVVKGGHLHRNCQMVA